MSADNRTVFTDALATLGTIIDETAGRDAIHLAVEPVIAAHTLRPGEDVGFLEDGRVGICDKPVGIVDPFLKATVKGGQRLWLVVYPRQITSLRHVWDAPNFKPSTDVAMPVQVPELSPKAVSEKWLREFIAASDCPDYDSVIAVATGAQLKLASEDYGVSYNNGEYLHFDGRDAHGEIPPEFWYHVEIVTGKKVPEESRASWFSCSC